jgi:hypothetical protein
MKDNAHAANTDGRLRQRLRAAFDELGALLPLFFSRDPVFRGYVGERTVRCGKPTCHCAAERASKT